MARSIRVAALQLPAHDRNDFERSLDSIVAAASEASQRADLVVLPEGTFPSYVLGDARIDHAAIDGALDRLRKLAQASDAVVVVGAATRSDGGLRNSAIVIDADGSIAGHADKLFLWHFDRLWFEPGDSIAPIATKAGKLGVLVCADGRIPTIARALVDQGAEMLVMPTAWVTTGRSAQTLENVQADLLARVRARENGVPFVAANKCGTELNMVAYCGKSQVIGADGAVLAMASQDRPQTLEATVVTGTGRPCRAAAGEYPQARAGWDRAPVRLAISPDPLPRDLDRRLALLGDAYALAPHDAQRLAALDRAIPAASVGDDVVLDPAGLVPYRRAGYPLAVWTAEAQPAWIEPMARARALELRMYLVVFDRTAERAFAVDPDGNAIAGTFDGYRLASFSLDPRRTIETTVAPETDVADALERIAFLTRTESAPA
ncbi:MAG: carbon-nitrogen hydrolase family protein [Candidatus Tumulicola sp.]